MSYTENAATAAYLRPDTQTAQGIREASLRNKADETNGYLRQALDMLDALEDALHGPSPRKGEMPNDPNPNHPGLRATIDMASANSAAVVSRMQTLLGSL